MGDAENPFSELINLIRAQARGTAPPCWMFGTVQSVNPLRVAAGGVVLEAHQIVDADAWSACLAPNDKVPLLPDAEGALFLIIKNKGGAAP